MSGWHASAHDSHCFRESRGEATQNKNRGREVSDESGTHHESRRRGERLYSVHNKKKKKKKMRGMRWVKGRARDEQRH